MHFELLNITGSLSLTKKRSDIHNDFNAFEIEITCTIGNYNRTELEHTRTHEFGLYTCI